jgi:hypothetical protein
MHTFKGGAKRAERVPEYHRIPLALFKRTALRFSLGATRYGEGNYRKSLGDDAFIKQAIDHAIEHLILYANGDRADDHLAAVAWACAVLMEGGH